MYNKDLELISIPYSLLLKIEVPRLIHRVIDTVQDHEPEELQIKEMFDLLVLEKPRLSKLIDKYAANPLNEDLYNKRSMRAFYISSLRFHLKKVIKENKIIDNRDVNVVKDSLNHFFYNLDLSTNEEMFNQKITQFFEKVETNAKLNSALRTLNFMEHLENLELVHADIQMLIKARTVSYSVRPKETTEELKKMVITPMKNLIKQIEIAPLKHPELDYGPLFHELNVIFNDYRNQINNRILANKRKAEKLNGEPEVSTEMMTTTPTTTETAEPEATMLPLSVDEENTNGGFETPEEVDKKKAAALSSKTMQLPLDDNNEASEK